MSLGRDGWKGLKTRDFPAFLALIEWIPRPN